MTRKILTRGAAGLALASLVAGALAVPTIASAQPAPAYQGGAYGQGGYYDPCRRDQVQRGTGGALVGGGLGALAGSSIAGRGAKTEGAVLGGILGAVIGANVGKSGAACETPYDPARPAGGQAYYGQPGAYDSYGGYGADQGADGYYGYEQRAYDESYRDSRDDYRTMPVADGPTADNCSLAESPIYLPDGRVQKRFVRVCRDTGGDYQETARLNRKSLASQSEKPGEGSLRATSRTQPPPSAPLAANGGYSA